MEIKQNTSKITNGSENKSHGKFKNILKYIKIKTYQHLHDVAKVLRGEFIVLNTFIGKEQGSEINDIRFYLKKLAKENLI